MSDRLTAQVDLVARVLHDWLAEHGIHDAGVTAIQDVAERVLAAVDPGAGR